MVNLEVATMSIAAVGGAILFGATVFAFASGFAVGPYGSIPAAVICSGIGFVGLLVAVLSCRDRLTQIDPLRAYSGGLSCCGASMLLILPLPATPTPVGQAALGGAVLLTLGGVVLLATTVDHEQTEQSGTN